MRCAAAEFLLPLSTNTYEINCNGAWAAFELPTELATFLTSKFAPICAIPVSSAKQLTAEWVSGSALAPLARRTRTMAKVTPPLASIHPLTVGDHAELAMLSRLAHGLSAGWRIHWLRVGARSGAAIVTTCEAGSGKTQSVLAAVSEIRTNG
jgi:hypothetical protein